MELNRDQIVKALEHCGRIGETAHNCWSCPLHEKDYCSAYLAQRALALIRKLDRDNDMWRETVERLISTMKMYDVPCPEGLQIFSDFCEKCKREAKVNTLKDMHLRFAMHFGTYRREDSIKVSDVFALLEKFTEEMLEEA